MFSIQLRICDLITLKIIFREVNKCVCVSLLLFIMCGCVYIHMKPSCQSLLRFGSTVPPSTSPLRVLAPAGEPEIVVSHDECPLRSRGGPGVQPGQTLLHALGGLRYDRLAQREGGAECV